MQVPRIGIVTVSDRASAGVYEDRSGPAILDCLMDAIRSPWETLMRCVPDDRGILEATLRELCDSQGCCLVLTTGGTGPAPRDLTPEATTAVCDRIVPGFGERMRAASWAKVPTAILSRAIAGTRGQTLIVNLPGNPKAARECLEAVLPAIPDAVELLGGLCLDLGIPGAHHPHHPHDPSRC